MKTPNNGCKRDHSLCCSSNREKMKIIQKKKKIAGLVRMTIDMCISSFIKHNKFVICASFLHLHMSGNFLFYVLLKQQIIIKIIAMSIYVRRRLRIFKKRNNSKILYEFSGRQRDLSQKKKFCVPIRNLISDLRIPRSDALPLRLYGERGLLRSSSDTRSAYC